MTLELVNLKPVHKAVARDIALGLRLTDICKSRGLNFGTWNNVACGELFKSEVARMQQEIEDAVIDDVITDPVAKRLKTASTRAAEVLVEELDNHEKEDGASSSTRQNAATAILDRTGYTKKEVTPQSVVVLNLSPDLLKNMTTGTIPKQPEHFDAEKM